MSANKSNPLSQFSCLRSDKAVADEIMEAAESERDLPQAARNRVSPAMIRALMAGKTEGPAPQATRPLTEAIVLLNGRPSLLVRNDTFELPTLAEWRNRLLPYRSKIDRVIKSVGRVELSNHPDYEWAGTAWMITEDVVATNRHVAQLFAERKGNGFAFIRSFDTNQQVSARVDFKEEYRTGAVAEVVVKQILFVEENGDRNPDLALLRLDKSASLPQPVILASKNAVANRFIGVVGYPARDSRNDHDAMVRIFGDIYDVKRFAPGQISSVPGDAWFITHDCSTLGGNSGSVVFDLESGEAVGLHFGGRFRQANYAVKVEELRKALGRLKVSVPVARPMPEAETEAPAAKPSDYDDRQGYDPNFLGAASHFQVPLPKLNQWSKDAAPVAGAPSNAKKVLRYTHFSVVMSKSRRLSLVTAVNIDGGQLLHLPRKGDRWYLDPRISKEHQIGNELYTSNDLDRGHMVRRLDPVWGGPNDAKQANEDTFHYTNACPQHADLNQKIWNDLENYILDNANARELKVSVFTGPVLRNDDGEYRGIQLPREFWKVAVLVNDATGKLSATAYLLSQATMIDDLEFAYGKFRTYQVAITRVEDLTNLSFGNLRDHDPFKQESITELPGVGAARLLARVRDIVL